MVRHLPFALLLALVGGCSAGGEGTGGTTVAETSGAATSSGSGDGSSSSSSTAGESQADTTSGTSGTTGGGCALDVEIEVLSAHLGDLESIAGAIGGTPSALDVVGFLAAPGLGARASVLEIAALDAPCTAPDAFEPTCAGGSCAQVACTGEGASWTLTAWIDEVPAQAGDFTFSELAVTVSWSEGESAVAFQIASKATKGPATWSVSANGRIDGGAFEVVALLPELIDGAEVVLVASGGGDGFAGGLEVDGVEVAVVGGDGGMTATGACW